MYTPDPLFTRSIRS